LDFGKGIFGDQSFSLRRIEELPGYSAAFASGVVAELATTITIVSQIRHSLLSLCNLFSKVAL
jgi:hypothetical protein